MSRKKFTTRIPYENAVAFRDDLLRIYHRNLQSGYTPAAVDDAELFRKVFSELCGVGSPRSGWSYLATELRLVELACGSIGFESGGSQSEIVDRLSSLIAVLEKASDKAASLFADPTFIAASVDVKQLFAFHADSDVLRRLVHDLNAVGIDLAKLEVDPKWRVGNPRRRRLKLAALLAPIFEDQFDQPANPIGGSALLPDDRINDWTRFFQMAATIFWNEKVTPDRQAVLREAKLPPGWPADATHPKKGS